MEHSQQIFFNPRFFGIRMGDDGKDHAFIVSRRRMYTMDMTKKWFIAKTYGWGWVPVTWQGWAVTILYIALIVRSGRQLEGATGSGANILPFTIQVLLATIVLLGICYLTGEKPRWRWGSKK